jgi:hypothetical protein
MGARIKQRLLTLTAMVSVLAFAALPAFAQTEGTELDAVNAGVASLVDGAKSIVTDNITVVVGLLMLTIGLPFAIKFARRFIK